jgi:hypothetical protein
MAATSAETGWMLKAAGFYPGFVADPSRVRFAVDGRICYSSKVGFVRK